MCGRTSRLDRGVNGLWARIRSCSRQRGAATSPWSRRSSASEPRGVVHWQGGCHCSSGLDTFRSPPPFLITEIMSLSPIPYVASRPFGEPTIYLRSRPESSTWARDVVSRIPLSNRRRTSRAPFRRIPFRVSPISERLPQRYLSSYAQFARFRHFPRGNR